MATRRLVSRPTLARSLRSGKLRGCRPLRAYCAVRAHIAPSELGAATPTASHPRPWWAATFNFRTHPSMVGMVGAWVRATGGPLRAHGEVRAHLATGKFGTTTPTALHLRPSGRHFYAMGV